LFEIGNRFDLGAAARAHEGAGVVGAAAPSPGPGGPASELHEIETLAGIVTGARMPEQWGSAREAADFYDVKGDLMRALALTGNVSEVTFEPATLGCLRPGRAARILRHGVALGWLGELHPQINKGLSLPVNTVVFELDVQSAFVAKPPSYLKISKFPSVRRDLAVVVDESLPLAVLQENVTVSAAGLLSELRVFDVYRGPGVDSGRKSIALGLILQDSSRTLTDVDADAVVTRVVTRLRDELSASIRD
jgi:phenylalanyl-tRNA synthetase beta chain